MKETVFIQGGRPLSGTIRIGGSKNLAIKALVASLLTQGTCRLENVPSIGDVEITESILAKLGVKLTNDRGTVSIDAAPLRKHSVPLQLGRLNRISVLFLGPLLHRFRKAIIPHPGGCDIGRRPIDYHLDFLTCFGAKVKRSGNYYFAECTELRGSRIKFDYPSTTATEHALLTAVLARGRTTIVNPALNPEVLHLSGILRAMGARISLLNATFVIEGVNRLQPFTFIVPPDRNEAATYAIASLLCGGQIAIEKFPAVEMTRFLQTLEMAGATYEHRGNTTKFRLGKSRERNFCIETGPYPRFESDWLPMFFPLLNLSDGISRIHETVFENRLQFAHQLSTMGMSISLGRECPDGNPCRLDGHVHTATISGSKVLRPGHFEIQDLRGGAAIVLAALSQRGKYSIGNSDMLRRGYNNFFCKLRNVGAEIT